MKFNEGDKVSFINEKQNGIVVKHISENLVLVEIEDGFEIQVSVKELVKIENVKKEKEKTEIPELKKTEIEIVDLNSIVAPNCIAIVAVPQVAVLTGSVSYHLVNNTDFKLLFTFYINHSDSWKGTACGIADEGSASILLNMPRADLTDVSSFRLQGLTFKEGHSPGPMQINKEVNIFLPDLSSSNKQLNGMAAFAKSVVVYSYEEVITEVDDFKDLIAKFGDKNIREEKPYSPKGKYFQPEKYGILENEKEIDLHIEEITSDFAGLSNAEMLNIQLKFFNSEMDNALIKHFKKLIIIHGVGNGKLKSEIRKELRNYNNVAFKDGDFRKYGYGATEVIFQ